MLWIAKAGAILLTGDQPAHLFEIAPVFMATALLGLHTLLDGRGGTFTRIDGFATYGCFLLSLASVAVYAQGAESTSEETFDPLIFMAFLSLVASLILLGAAYRRTDDALIRWQSLPLVLGVAMPLMMIGGGVLEAVNERLLEVPIVILGLGWIMLGVALVTAPTSRPLPDGSAL